MTRTPPRDILSSESERELFDDLEALVRLEPPAGFEERARARYGRERTGVARIRIASLTIASMALLGAAVALPFYLFGDGAAAELLVAFAQQLSIVASVGRTALSILSGSTELRLALAGISALSVALSAVLLALSTRQLQKMELAPADTSRRER